MPFMAASNRHATRQSKQLKFASNVRFLIYPEIRTYPPLASHPFFLEPSVAQNVYVARGEFEGEFP